LALFKNLSSNKFKHKIQEVVAGKESFQQEIEDINISFNLIDTLID
jgi:hypothetical protein